MADEQADWYPSKVDRWLGMLLVLIPVVPVVVCVTLALDGKFAELWIGVAGLLGVVALYMGLVVPMTYGLSDEHLIVRFGMVRQRIPLKDVVEVYPTRNPLSSPALSLDRLRVQCGEGFFKAVMISPADREGFLDALAARTGLTRNGDRLVWR